MDPNSEVVWRKPIEGRVGCRCFWGCPYKFGLFFLVVIVMCEFNVIVNGKVEFKDVIYTKVDGDKVTVKNIMGQSKEFLGFRIVEVDVPTPAWSSPQLSLRRLAWKFFKRNPP